MLVNDELTCFQTLGIIGGRTVSQVIVSGSHITPPDIELLRLPGRAAQSMQALLDRLVYTYSPDSLVPATTDLPAQSARGDS